jgi:hypothetical protein
LRPKHLDLRAAVSGNALIERGTLIWHIGWNNTIEEGVHRLNKRRERSALVSQWPESLPLSVRILATRLGQA